MEFGNMLLLIWEDVVSDTCDVCGKMCSKIVLEKNLSIFVIWQACLVVRV
jgi:hypothetical protein